MIKTIPAPVGAIVALDMLASNPAVQEMRRFRQHRGTNTYDHCKNTALACCWAAHKLGCRDETVIAAARAAMLHDFYLYDYHGSRRGHGKWHAWSHPQAALQNAMALFSLDKKEQNAIRSHMFPGTICHIPKYAAAWLVSCMDKAMAVCELLSLQPFRYASLVPA